MECTTSISTKIKSCIDRSKFLLIVNAFYNFIEKISNQSFINRMFNSIGMSIRKSFTFTSFIKTEEEISIPGSSFAINKFLGVMGKNIKKMSEIINGGFITYLFNAFLNNKVFFAALIILFATITNTVFWFLFREFNEMGLMFRLILIIISMTLLKLT